MLSDLHHVAFVVQSVDEAMEFVERIFGLKPISRNRFVEDGVDLAIYQVGESYFEVSGPIGEDSPLARYLAEKGPGIHHVAFGSADLLASIDELTGRGAAVGDGRPRVGRSGWTVLNVDSQTALGVGVQLVQR